MKKSLKVARQKSMPLALALKIVRAEEDLVAGEEEEDKAEGSAINKSDRRSRPACLDRSVLWK